MPNINKSVLLNSHLFNPLKEEQVDRVLSSTREIHLGEGNTLFRQGDKANYFYLVLEGDIKLFRISAGGNEKIIEIASKYHTFAEAVMFLEQPHYPVSAEAINASVLYRFNIRTYLELLSQSRELCFALLGDLSIRLRRMLNEIERLSLENGRFRVIQYLDEVADRSNQDSIKLHIKKKIIASRLSLTPETLSRIFKELVEEEIISISGKSITIHDRSRLKGFGQAE
ncbi:MAG: Crp/Fnr family transcriptional regulator [Gammaproteobacteria bacterium]|nr:Crp/Fnr family transcriptional regulator [Gammaproteobacteria bacterium]